MEPARGYRYITHEPWHEKISTDGAARHAPVNLRIFSTDVLRSSPDIRDKRQATGFLRLIQKISHRVDDLLGTERVVLNFVFGTNTAEC